MKPRRAAVRIGSTALAFCVAVGCEKPAGDDRSGSDLLEAVQQNPSDLEATASLESAFQEERSLRVAHALIEAYSVQGLWGDASRILESMLEVTEPQDARLGLVAHLSDQLERRKQDPVHALDLWLRMYAEAPAHPRTFRAVRRLAELTGNWAGVVAASEAALQDDPGLDTRTRVAMLKRMARIQQRFGDVASARATLSRVLDLAPEESAAKLQLSGLAGAPEDIGDDARFELAPDLTLTYAETPGFHGDGIYVAPNSPSSPGTDAETIVLVRQDGPSHVRVLPPETTTNNKWNFSLPGDRKRTSDESVQSLIALPAEGFYSLRGRLLFEEDGRWTVGAIVQLGYTLEGQPILFIAQGREGPENDLWFDEVGVGIRRDQLNWLKPLGWYVAPAQ